MNDTTSKPMNMLGHQKKHKNIGLQTSEQGNLYNQSPFVTLVPL
jgi:hypothetical protein